MTFDELGNILDRIASGKHAEADIVALRQLLSSSDRQSLLQLGKYGINVGQGQDIQIGDRDYQCVGAEAIREIIRSILQELQSPAQPAMSQGILPLAVNKMR